MTGGPLMKSSADAEIFGHPKGLAVLFATEMWERFSFYGMRALLVLYMLHRLLQPGQVESVWGFARLRAVLEALSGPLAVQPLASQIYGLYTGFVYLTPVFGGLLADRLLGRRRTVILGALLMAAGHFMMAFEPLFLLALLTLILGNGAFKPNISTQVGGLYPPGDGRRDRAYSIFYVGINLGAFLAPLVCGTLGEHVGWHWGFAAAGIGMAIGLGIYLSGLRRLPPDAPRQTAADHALRPMDGQAWRAVAALLVLCGLSVLFWGTYEQQGNTIALWADAYTDRHIDLGLWRGVVPTTWFQAVNPFLIFAFTPAVVALWARQARRRAEPSAVAKMALGCLGPVVANLIMAWAAWQAGPQGTASWLWLLGYFVALTLGELYLSPIGLSLVSKVAPPSILSMMMGVWFISSFAGGLLAGWLGSLWSGMDKADFFLLMAAIAATASALIGLCAGALGSVLHRAEG
jgi:proton-dependent oligopeptide transporter, POT family